VKNKIVKKHFEEKEKKRKEEKVEENAKPRSLKS